MVNTRSHVIDNRRTFSPRFQSRPLYAEDQDTEVEALLAKAAELRAEGKAAVWWLVVSI